MFETLDTIFDYIKDLSEEQQTKWLKEASHCYSRCRSKGMGITESEKMAIKTADELVNEHKD